MQRKINLIDKIMLFCSALTLCGLTSTSYASEETNAEGKRAQALEHSRSRLWPDKSFCDRVQANVSYQKYAKLAGDADRGGYSDVINRAPTFDTDDGLLHQWLNKVAALNIANDKVLAEVTSCFDKLLPTDFAYIFVSPESVGELRRMLEAPKVEKTVREVTSSGDVVERKVQDDLLKEYVSKRNDLFKYKTFPHYLALIYGGEEILAISSAEYLSEIESGLATYEKQLNEKLAAKEKQLKEESVEKQRLAKIQKGDYSLAKSCLEIAKAVAPASTKIFRFETFVTPSEGLYYGSGKLINHANSAKFSEELIRDLNTKRFAKLQIRRGAKIFDEQMRKIDGIVSFFGKYSSNSAGKPVLNVTCAEYDDEFSFVAKVFTNLN